MNFLFVHRHFPGQFRHLVHLLCRQGHHIVGIGEKESLEAFALPAGATLYAYGARSLPKGQAHRLAHHYDEGIRRGLAVARIATSLKNNESRPDVIVAHTGWGEALFLKEIFPESKLIGYFEYYYLPEFTDLGFDPEYPLAPDDKFTVRTANAINLTSLTACDGGFTPTHWQKSHYPKEFWPKLEVIHEGIDTRTAKPNPAASFALPSGKILTRADQVVTYVSRCLEPYRGFHVFMRALPRLLQGNKDVQIVIAGGDCVRYSPAPKGPGSYKDALLQELGPDLDLGRVHFVGNLSYPDYLSLLQVSSVHAYLTYPFVLSWSMLEAMAAGCVVLGSKTAPVMEVIEDGVNGFLVDFLDIEGITAKLAALLQDRTNLAHIGAAARETIVKDYDAETSSLPKLTRLFCRPANQQ